MDINILDLIIFFSGTLYVLTSLIYLFETGKTSANYIITGLLFVVGIWQLYHGFMISGLLVHYPHLAITHVPFLYITAPLLYSYMKILKGGSYTLTYKSALHLLPPVIMTIFLLPFYLKDAGEKREFILNPFGHSSDYPYYSLIIFLVVMAMCIYCIASLKKGMPLFRKKGLAIKKMTVYSILFIVINYLLIFFYIFGFTMFNLFNFSQTFYLFAIKSDSLILSIQIILVMIIKTRYPDYFNRILDEGQRIRYVTSRIEGLNVQDVLQRLERLMELDKIFCDEEITLGGLAGELDISHYQLSQILNEHLSKNFNVFINEYRIREAEKLLIDDPDRSIASISYAVGFNTISSFYNSFSKMHDTSPSAFRKTILKRK